VIFGSTTGAFSQSLVDQVGATADDTFTGTTAAEAFIGDAGDESFNGGGSADVQYSGTGNDTFHLDASTITGLERGCGDGNDIKINTFNRDSARKDHERLLNCDDFPTTNNNVYSFCK